MDLSKPESDELARLVSESDLRFVRLGWVDNAGIYRSHALSVNHFCELATKGLGLASGVQAVPVHQDSVAAGLPIGAVGQVWLVPDRKSFRSLPWQEGHGSVMGAFVTAAGEPWPYCPRTTLTRQLQDLAEVGLHMETAFEHEFMLLRRGENGPEHFEESHYAATHGLDKAGPILDEMALALESQGITVESILKEAGLSQFEIATLHADPMQSADHFVAVRETLSAVGLGHNLIATPLPLIFENESGNGWHLHFSLWQEDRNLTADGPNLAPLSAAFLAGVLEHLPGLCALTSPSTNSFRRIRPGAWAGAYQIWGYDHKEAALRVPTSRMGGPTNIELKVSDASANPYLSLSGLIGAGLDGIKRNLGLPEAVEVDAGNLNEFERNARGIEALPASLDAAVAALESDPVLLEVLGPDLAEAYLHVKKEEALALGPLSLEEEVSQLIETY